jgi:hypothetical protein
MNLPENPAEKPRSPYSYGMQMAMLGGEVGCLTLAIVLMAVFGGLWIDRLLGTKPIITIALVVGSAPLSMGLTFWLAIRAVKNANPIPGRTKGNRSLKEEESGE